MRQALLEHYEPMMIAGPLNRIIVLGFCYYVAGPIALQNLVAQGALVIKIERKPLGDPARYNFSSEIFNTLTHGQLSVGISDDAADRQLLNKLFEICDVIVDNRSVRAKEEDVMLSNFLHDENKNSPVIYCSIDGFPNSEINRLPGLDASAQACTGFAYSNCFSQNYPLKVGVPILDITTGLLAANYILANLHLLGRGSLLPPETKQVVRIAVSLAGTSVWLQANQFLEAMAGREYFRKGNQDKYAAPFSYYTAKDGLISIATVNENQFEKFCINILRDRGFYDRYPTIKKRVDDQDNFEQELNQILKRENREYWLSECKKYDIPAAPVLTVAQALEQNFVRGLIAYSQSGKPIVTPGVKHSLFSLGRPLPAPELNGNGEDVRSIMKTLHSKL